MFREILSPTTPKVAPWKGDRARDDTPVEPEQGPTPPFVELAPCPAKRLEFEEETVQKPPKKKSRYRPDIDGMRTLAVCVVTAFHVDEHK